MKNDCKYSEEGVSLCSGRFGKALEMRVASEGFLRIPVVQSLWRWEKEGSACAQREEAVKEERRGL